ESVVDQLGDSWEYKKIYLFDYPFEGFEKPRAADDIINAVNQGTFSLNFVGHGAAEQWSDENIMRIETVGRMKNSGHYFFSWTASCGNSEFDKVSTQGISEYLVKVSESGAMATVGAVRSSYPEDNLNLMRAFFKILEGNSLGGALSMAKQNKAGGSTLNTHKYILFGDPATFVFNDLRRISLALDVKNNSRIDSVFAVDSLVWDSISLDTVKGSQSFFIKGAVLDKSPGNQIDTGFSGKVSVKFLKQDIDIHKKVEGAENTGRYPNGYADYKLPGGLFFQVEGDVKSGYFKIPVTMPKKITYDDSLNRVIVFAQGDENSAFSGYAKGILGNLTTYGTVPTNTDDSAGPAISFYIESPRGVEIYRLNRGAFLDSSTRIKIIMIDSGGILANSTEPGEGLFYEVEGLTLRRRFKPTFINESDSGKGWNVSQRGYIYLDFLNEDLLDIIKPEKNYLLKVYAQDQNGNKSTETLEFTFTQSDTTLTITDVFCYPNPFRDSTRLFWTTSYASPIKVRMRIFTPTGRLILQKDWQAVESPRTFPITWNGFDQEKARCANNVYFCKLDLSTKISNEEQKRTFLLKMMLRR
ncbi:MAG: C25 family cysteine peptidase, partial [bacterium]